ncbi:MAG: HEAT repeat domain-containing protein [Pirellulales bacterium]|nr:HEAT repeat domain-containing protein [Pirellulales bacterium]
MFSFRRYTDVAMLTLGLALFPALAGCNGLGFGWDGPSVRSAQKAEGRKEDQFADPAALANDDRAVFARVAEKDAQGIERCVWIRAVDPESPFRWRYPKLEAALAQPVEQRPNLAKLLADRDPKAAFNAAIALGRWGDKRTIPTLSKAVQTPTLPLPMRCAAAEALGCLNEPSSAWPEGNEAVPDLRKLIDRYGRYSPKSAASYVSELHLELLRSLALSIDATDDERFVSALKSPRAEVREEALVAWSASKSGKLPQEAADLRTDGDARVRAAALAAFVAQKHPQTLDYLRRGLNDANFTVRRAAIAGLGKLGGEEALSILKEQYRDRSDGVRAEAVKAFAAMRAEQQILEAVGDKSWRVRLGAARALTIFPSAACAASAEKLLDDPSAEVQLAAVLALKRWPRARSGPVMLAAMGKSVLAARKAAAEQLAEWWPPAAEFPADGPAERRAKILRDLELQYGSRFGVIRASGLESLFSPRHERRAVSPQAIANVESMLASGDVRALISYGPGLIDVLEELRFERKRTLPETVYREVLPRLNPVYSLLDRLASRDLSERRRAAEELQSLAAKQSSVQPAFDRLALDRLAQLMAAESDDLVWLSILRAISNENGDEAATLACAALGHPACEVRRRACMLMAAHPDRRHASLLLPALEDSQPLVVCAALEALGAGGMDDPAPIKRLLNSPSDEIQLAAATTLMQLNDAAGKPALERLAHSGDPLIRARAARAMGEFPDPAFLPILIHLLSDKADVSRSALMSLPQVAGEDISQPAGQPPASTAERISRWKRWFEREGSASPHFSQ